MQSLLDRLCAPVYSMGGAGPGASDGRWRRDFGYESVPVQQTPISAGVSAPGVSALFWRVVDGVMGRHGYRVSDHRRWAFPLYGGAGYIVVEERLYARGGARVAVALRIRMDREMRLTGLDGVDVLDPRGVLSPGTVREILGAYRDIELIFSRDTTCSRGGVSGWRGA